MDVAGDELEQVRDQLRQHVAVLAGHGKDPRAGLTWGPMVERLDELLAAAAASGGLRDVPPRPWTNDDRLDVDERCRRAGIVSGPPLI